MSLKIYLPIFIAVNLLVLCNNCFGWTLDRSTSLARLQERTSDTSVQDDLEKRTIDIALGLDSIGQSDLIDRIDELFNVESRGFNKIQERAIYVTGGITGVQTLLSGGQNGIKAVLDGGIDVILLPLHSMVYGVLNIIGIVVNIIENIIRRYWIFHFDPFVKIDALKLKAYNCLGPTGSILGNIAKGLVSCITSKGDDIVSILNAILEALKNIAGVIGSVFNTIIGCSDMSCRGKNLMSGGNQVVSIGTNLLSAVGRLGIFMGTITQAVPACLTAKVTIAPLAEIGSWLTRYGKCMIA